MSELNTNPSTPLVALLSGDHPFPKDCDALKLQPRIIISSLGRLVAMVRTKKISFKNLHKVVLDQLDNFIMTYSERDDLESVLKVLSENAPNHDVIAFMSCQSEQVEREYSSLSKKDMSKILHITCDDSQLQTLFSHVVWVGEEGARPMESILRLRADELSEQRVVVLCNYKDTVYELCKRSEGLAVVSFHSLAEATSRKRALELFRDANPPILVSTRRILYGVPFGHPHALLLEVPPTASEFLHILQG